MSRDSAVLSAEERFRKLQRAKEAKTRQRLLRWAYQPVYDKYRAVVPSIFARNGKVNVYNAVADEGRLIDSLKGLAVFTLDTAARLRWGIRLVNAPNVCAYLQRADDLKPLASRGLIEPNPVGSFIYAPPFRTGVRLLAVMTPELPPHETLASGHRVVTTDFLVREYLGVIGLRLDLFTLLDTYIERDREHGQVPQQ